MSSLEMEGFPYIMAYRYPYRLPASDSFSVGVRRECEFPLRRGWDKVTLGWFETNRRGERVDELAILVTNWL